ncbi:MFS transporter [Geobacillus sp. C56-T3]|uniref:MFS transporter n=1 Tax=Geobacillus sp. (strain C56-T3) TaxID=691437 RepID=UPI0001D58782|nr:MFS transporter [Geobacillus sp. C56-T3]ADI27045.1 major facilitator superfamily MFS_1 [Geobacillus sp. C56-T3]
MERGWKRYHTVWLMLFLGWVVSYIDRTLTGPVVTWMIENKVEFLAESSNPHALGGLLGSLFFAGYMLTQFPGGYFGDKFGYRVIVIISIIWAGVTTLLTGLVGGLVAFIALRVLTGLGEGVFYSNDRSLITQVTPPEKVGLGMGVVLTGLTLGLTIATIATPYVIQLFQPSMGTHAWKAPFLLMGAITLIVGAMMYKWMRPDGFAVQSESYGPPVGRLLQTSFLFLIIIMTLYYATNAMQLSPATIGLVLTALAVLYIVYIYKAKSEEVGPILKSRNLLFLYLSFIPVLWHLWFYGFWSVAIVQDFGGGTLVSAALIASFNAVAGLIGFPLGGRLADRFADGVNGKRNVLAVLTGLLTVFIFIFAFYVMSGGSNPVIMSLILFTSGVFFFALQPVNHALTADFAPPKYRGAAFGMLNLFSEIGALLAPVISGAMRDHSGSWGSALLLDGILMAASLLLVIAVKPSLEGRLTTVINAQETDVNH